MRPATKHELYYYIGTRCRVNELMGFIEFGTPERVSAEIEDAEARNSFDEGAWDAINTETYWIPNDAQALYECQEFGKRFNEEHNVW